MNQRLLILTATLWLLTTFSPPLGAQVGFSLPFINEAAPNQVMNLPLSVSNFDSIVSAQFVIQWDPEVLQFLTVGTFGLPALSAGQFGLDSALTQGYLRFAWTCPQNVDTIGISVPDGTEIFKLKFKVIGEVLSGTPVEVTELLPLTVFEVGTANGVQYGFASPTYIPPALDQGFVAVGYTVAAGEPAGRAPFTVTVSPNPFSENTRIVFDLESPLRASLLLTDAAGLVLFCEEKVLPAGQTGMEIEKAVLHAPGVYFLQVRAGGFSRTLRLLSH